MKCPSYEAARANKMERGSANMAAAAGAQPKVVQVKASPVKEDPIPLKPSSPPANVATKLFSQNNNTRVVHNKENSSNKEHERTALDEGFEDSGYLSLHNSQIFDHHEEEEYVQGKPTAALQHAPADKKISPSNSPSKCQTRMNSPMAAVVTASTPLPKRRTEKSTLSNHYNDHYLPILKFQRTVCEELAKSYQKNKR